MTATAQFNVCLYSMDQPLTDELLFWLDNNKPHDIFSSPEWYQALVHFKQLYEKQHAADFYWFIVLDKNEPCVAAPLEVKGNKIKFVSNFYSPFTELYFDRLQSTSQDAWQLLLSQLTQLRPKWLSIDISPLLPEQVQQLDLIGRSQPLNVFEYHFSANYSSSYYSFETYWARRSSRLRNTHKRRAKLANKHQLQFQIHDVCTQELQADYWQIYQHSWKVQEPSRCFINWLMTWAEQNNRLKLGMLKIDGEPAAFQLWLINGSCGSIFKLAQDKRFDALSPGTLLMEHMVRSLSQKNGVTKIDFLLGNDEFKALWMDEKILVSGVEVINQSHLKGKLLSVVYKLKNWLKQTTISAHHGNKYD